MRTSVLSLLAAASVVSAQSSTTILAPKVTANPAGASYVATLPVKEGSSLRGSILAVTGPDGVGVKFSVSFSGLPATGGPFMYHLHEKPVVGGNCTSTGAHLDPYKRGEVPICDASKPETCQTGDLSGKFGNFSTAEYAKEYVDPYSSTDSKSNAFFGNLSFVLHLANKTRIGCANFAAPGGYPAGNATATIQPTGAPIKPTGSATSAPPQFTGAAVKIVGATGAMLAAAAAALVL